MTKPASMISAILIATHGACVLAGQIQGEVTNEQGTALQGVRICLSLPDTGTGQCYKDTFTDRNGSYSFRGLNEVQPYTVKVLTDGSLKARKADPYPRYAWGPASREVALASKKDKVGNIDFTGSFNFSNFQAAFAISGGDIPELGNYDLANDYVFLKIYTTDAGESDQNLIYLGQVTDIANLLIEVSVPLATTELLYEVYSAAAPEPVSGSISLAGAG
jgi:hypothetical protein